MDAAGCGKLRGVTGAQVIVQALEGAGVQVCFGLPGVHTLALWEALRTSGIRLVGVRHEQAAVYAADGYARATGKVGVALTTTGPGAANTLGAVGEAWASRSPVLVIATDIPTALRSPGVHRGALHEMEGQAELFRPLTKAVVIASDAEGLGRDVAAALSAAAGAPTRPVYLEVPTDLLRADARPAPVRAPSVVRARAAADRLVSEAAARLAGARRPLIWAGSGARDAAGAVGALAERLAAPVLTTYGARGLLAPEHPCSVTVPPHVAPAGALWDEADAVLAIGSDLDGMSTQNWAQPQPPLLVAVNLDAADATKNYDVDVLLEGDAAATCRALAEALPAPDPDALDALRDRLRDVTAQTCAALDDRGLRFLDCVAYGLPDDALVLADMCVPGYWIAALRTFRAPRRLLYPVGWGTLGFAFPASLGAALAGSGPAVSFSGDGGFLFACGELATVAQEQLPLTAVIFDDAGYGMLRHDQDRAGVPRHGVDLHSPDFEALARAFGLQAETVEGIDDGFGSALERHVADPAPSVLVVREEGLIPPPTTSPQWYRHRG
jgi:acetolactate synthase-1/2/3 large subunit